MRIADLEFSSEARKRLDAQLRRFPVFGNDAAAGHPLVRLLTEFAVTPVHYLERLLGECCRILELPFNVVRASEIEGLDGLRRQELMIGIAKSLRATEYVNLAGARALDLYDAAEFRRHGIQLRFLEDHRGPVESILGRLLAGSAEPIRREILANV